MNIVVLILAAVGLVVCGYAYFVEQKLRNQATYKAACDINNRISCSKAFMSKYANLMGISNSILGMVFYVSILIMALLGLNWLLCCATIAGAIASVVFAYLLYFKIRTFCFVCTTVYIINFSLLIAAMRG